MVVVTARASDKRLCSLLQGSCKNALSILVIDADAAALHGNGPDLVYLAPHSFMKLNCENAIFIVRDTGCLPETADCANAVAIVDSSNKPVMELVASRHLKALTCGLSNSDTFTLSSLTRDSAVISLRRQVTAFDGTSIEPFELPVSFSSPIEPFTLLACAAVFCMLGRKNPMAHAMQLELRQQK
ncbi:hypothetical protein [Anaerotruncus rubiinfantis]|uniref:hypothetical protein n=2 Tax=Anaerotruncus rubiinfantis TaxID=1720200 RepID=UPI0008301FF3|nr:hypothetical protein [Anaerotruncus rubiinfantis]